MSISNKTNQAVNKLTKKSFGSGVHFIVSAGNPSPSGAQVSTMIITDETTGFACTDKILHADSPDYNAVQLVGMQYNGFYENISVTGGEIFCILS